MVRETRHLWVGNLPESIREDRIREHFKRYGRVQSVKLLSRSGSGASPCAKECGLDAPGGGLCAAVAFMDIKSASKAHNAEHKLDERALTTEYYEPAAIPSSAGSSPAGSGFSGSSGSGAGSAGRSFPNNHGSSDEHPVVVGFERAFYERAVVRPEPEQYLRRPNNYHATTDPLRGRTRDRLYSRNGPPYTPILERTASVVAHHRVSGTWYEGSSTPSGTSRSTYGAVASAVVTPDTAYESERRSDGSEKSHVKKKTKSRSGSESPCGSTSSRSRSRSPSSCSSSHSGSSSNSRGSSSVASSGGTRSRALQSAVSAATPSNNPSVHAEDSRPLAICVRNLPSRSSDTSLKDGLFHEYKKHGKVTWVKVVGQSTDRYALVCFKKADDVEKALEVSQDKLFFGCKIEVAPYQGYDVDDNEFRPYEAELDEFHPKATRTLFIGNLEKDVTASELRKQFESFGEIIEIDIKKQGAVSSYAFCQYSDIISVVKAMRNMDGEHLGNNRIKLGFGKSMPTSCVWIDGVAENVSEKYLNVQFHQFGPITTVAIDRERGYALVFFDQIQFAQTAVKEMRGVALRGRKLQVDFASRECQEAFYEKLEKQGITDRVIVPFEGVREVSTRGFETTVVVPGARFAARYETPTRPRAASYSRPGNPVSAATGAASPTQSGANTPRGGSGRARLARYTSTTEYYDAAGDYADRRFRSYDEFSQGSAASHEDVYEQETYPYVRDHGDSPQGRVLPLDADPLRRGSRGEKLGSPCTEDDFKHRAVQSVVVAADVIQTGVPIFQPPDIRHLQKERVHLLEQLEECPSSGDELVSPKKRLKLDISNIDNSIQTNLLSESLNCDVNDRVNHNEHLNILLHHRKSVEVRRLSETSAKHSHCNSRRPSTDSLRQGLSGRDISQDRVVSVYTPHAVCKRRKTGNSISEGEHAPRGRGHPFLHSHHSHEVSGGESADGSRPGTPLCDERPENIIPMEPRRVPRDRSNDGPLCLPLPRFAAQVLHQTRMNISVAGSKSCTATNAVSSPPAVATSPRICPLPPSPSHVPPPASPPPRPPSLSSNSSDSELAPPSPTLEERIKSLDEKYEKWSGSRTFTHIGTPETSANVEANTPERFKFRHKLLDLDVNEVQPSDILKSVLAKRSVFDEDSKRLENISDKYEPRDFQPFSRTVWPIVPPIAQPPTTPTSAKAHTPVAVSPVLIKAIPITSSTPVNQIPTHITTTPINSAQSKSPYNSPTTVLKPVQVITAPSLVQVLPKTPNCMSPRPLTPLTPALVPAKGLQYPFPSHPPVLVTSQTTCTSTVAVTTATATVMFSVSSVENRTTVAAAVCAKTITGTTGEVSNKIVKTTLNKSSSLNERNSPMGVSANNKVLNKSASVPCNILSGVVNIPIVDKTLSTDSNILSSSTIVSGSSSSNANVDNNSVVNINKNPPKNNHVKKDDKLVSSVNKSNDKCLVNNKSEFLSTSASTTNITNPLNKIDRKNIIHRERSNDRESLDRRKNDDGVDKTDIDNKCDKPDEDKEKRRDDRLDREKQERDKKREEKENKEREENEKREHEEKLERERLELERIEKEKERRREKEEKEQREKEEQLLNERIEKEKAEKERLELLEKEKHERIEKERQEWLEKERLEKERRESKEREDREQIEKKEKEEKERFERKEKEERERVERKEKEEKERIDRKEKEERERIEQEQKEQEEKERLEKEKQEHLEKDRLEKIEQEKEYFEKLERDRLQEERRQKQKDEKEERERRREEKRHDRENPDNQSEHIFKDKPRKEHDGHNRHRDNHSSVDTHKRERIEDNNDSSRNRHRDSTTERHNHVHSDPRRDNSQSESPKERHSTDSDKTRHSSIESVSKERQVPIESPKERQFVDARRKERNPSSGSSPASVGCKRRMSSQDSLDSTDDGKRPKLVQEHRKVLDRRDSSKDPQRNPVDKPRHKYNKSGFKQLEDKIREDKRQSKESEERQRHNSVEDRSRKESEERKKDKEHREKEKESDRHKENKMKPEKIDKQERNSCDNKHRNKKNNRDSLKDIKIEIKIESIPLTPIDITPLKEREMTIDNDFLARLELRSSEEDERQRAQRKEMKEKKRQHQLQQIHQLQMQQEALQQEEYMKQHGDERRTSDEIRKKEKEIRSSTERKSRDECCMNLGLPLKSTSDLVRKKIRKLTNSSDTTDSDEPKKHSIFDIVDEGPTYISMYDKVKARSCKNMQKQEEEKRQEKIKAKFSQLKQSRAKREEKKRSTSWDEDSESGEDRLEQGERQERSSSKLGKRSNKNMINSSSEDEHFRRKHRELCTDSDSDRLRFSRDRMLCDGESTDGERTKILSRKTSRSRIHSDTSDDDMRHRRLVIKTEQLTDNEIDLTFAETEEKLEKLFSKQNIPEIKIEKIDARISCNERSYFKCENIPADKTIPTVVSENEIKKPLANSGISDIKLEKEIKIELKHEPETESVYDKFLCDISSEGENQIPETKKCLFNNIEKLSPESRKKHRKKQKRQKSSQSPAGDKPDDFHENVDSENFEHERRKHSSKKDKKRDKIKDEERQRDTDKMRSKKSRKLKSEQGLTKQDSMSNSSLKREEKMQDIFGLISDDDSQPANVKNCVSNHIPAQVKPSFFERISNKIKVSGVGVSDSEPVPNMDLIKSPKLLEPTEKERAKEESRKRKERKRKERLKRITKDDENSVDMVEAGRALEAKLMDDSPSRIEENEMKQPVLMPSVKQEKADDTKYNTTGTDVDVFRFTDGDDSLESGGKKDNHDLRKELKEKRKKKKKNKEDKLNHRKEHHHHHHDRSNEKNSVKVAPDRVKKELIVQTNLENIKPAQLLDLKPPMPSPSLPCITDSPPHSKNASNLSLSMTSMSRDSIISPIPNTPTSVKPAECKRHPEKLIPGFSVDIDEKIHENAVKSISNNFTIPTTIKNESDIKSESAVTTNVIKSEEKIEDKPRVIISQEETEDAVAALLGESFASGGFDNYGGETSPTAGTTKTPPQSETNIPDDEAEEMRQAVQSLNSGDLDIKPDTPQSEHDLQIDTDDECNEEFSGLRFDNPPKTPDCDLSQVTKPAGVVTSYYSSRDSIKTTQISAVKLASEITIPALMKPLSSFPSVITKSNHQPEPIKPLDISTSPEKVPPQSPTVISKSWSLSDHKPKDHRLVIEQRVPDSANIERYYNAATVQQIPASLNRPMNVISQNRPVANYAMARLPSPYALAMSHMPRMTTPYNVQPPVIKIPDQHTHLYQNPVGIMVSPKINTESRMLSPKKQHEGFNSMDPRMPSLTNVSVGMSLHGQPNSMLSHTSLQPRQQSVPIRHHAPQLNPVKATHLQSCSVMSSSKQTFNAIPLNVMSPSKQTITTMPLNTISPSKTITMMSLNTSTNLSRIPVTPVLAPISKPLHPTNVVLPQPKIAVSSLPNVYFPTPAVHQQHKITLPKDKQLVPPSESHTVAPAHQVHATSGSMLTSYSSVLTPKQHVPPTQTPVALKIVHHQPLISTCTQKHAIHIQSSNIITGEKPKSVIESLTNAPVVSKIMSTAQCTTPSHQTPVQIDAYATPSSILSSDYNKTSANIDTPKSTEMIIPTSNIIHQVLSNKQPSNKIVTSLEVPEVSVQQDKLVKSVTKPEESKIILVTEELASVPTSTPSPVIVTVQNQTPCTPVTIEDAVITTKSVKPEEKIELIKGTPVVPLVATETKPVLIPIISDVKEMKVVSNELVLETVKSELSDTVSVIKENENNLPIAQATDKATGSTVIKGTEASVTSIESVVLPNDGDKKNAHSITDRDGDFWSAKEVHIESVIKKVDALCAAEEPSIAADASRDEEENNKKIEPQPIEGVKPEPCFEKPGLPQIAADLIKTESDFDEGNDNCDVSKDINGRGSGRRGRMRGRKSQIKIDRLSQVQSNAASLQSRRGKGANRRGRGSRGAKVGERKTRTQELSGDVYDFHDDSGEETKADPARPRLILTIKSSVPTITTTSVVSSVVSSVTTTSALSSSLPKVQPVPYVVTIPANEGLKDDFVQPSLNTRKSRRLAERDGTRNTVDDVIEDVIRNIGTARAVNTSIGTVTVGQSVTGPATPRRSTRQNIGAKVAPNDKTNAAGEVRKSPRAKRSKDRTTSETSIDSSDEKTSKAESKNEVSENATSTEMKQESNPVCAPVNPKSENIATISSQVPVSVGPIVEKNVTNTSKLLQKRPGPKSLTEIQEPQEALTLIDPVTGELTVMRQSKEGQYVPVPGVPILQDVSKSSDIKPVVVTSTPLSICTKTSLTTCTSTVPILTPVVTVGSQSQPATTTVVTATRPQTLKSHVLSSQQPKQIVATQLANVVNLGTITQPSLIQSCTLSQTIVSTGSVQVGPQVVNKCNTVTSTTQIAPTVSQKPLSNLPPNTLVHGLTVNVNMANMHNVGPGAISPRLQQSLASKTQNIHPSNLKLSTVPGTNILPGLPKQYVVHTQPVKQQQQPLQISQQIAQKPIQKPQTNVVSNISKQPAKHNIHHLPQPVLNQGPIIGKGLPTHLSQVKLQNAPAISQSKGVLGLHGQQQILTGAVASPPLKQPHLIGQQPVVTGASSSRAAVPSMSPQGQPTPTVGPPRSQVLQAGMPVLAYEASLLGEMPGGFIRSQSPPPAHQQASPITPGESTHFPPAPLRVGVPIGSASRDLPPHYVMYQQYMRAQQLPYMARSPMLPGAVEPVPEGPETSVDHDEALPASPPLELRRPASGSSTISSARSTTSVPHSLQSPHDRTTDSPQAAQVYVHGARIPHPHYPTPPSSRYYEQPMAAMPTEPPPAHRPHSIAQVAQPANLTSSIHPTLIGAHKPQIAHTNEHQTVVPAHQSSISVPNHGSLVPAHSTSIPPSIPNPSGRSLQVTTPPHASQVPPQADSLLMLLQRYPVMWQGLLALKNDQAAVQMHFVYGNPHVARNSLPCNLDGSTPPLRIAQRMRLEQMQVEGVARKMQMENEHCMLLALPCGHDHMDVLQQSTNLSGGFITYLQQKQAAGIVNIAAPGSQQAAYVVHIFPSCEFANDNLARIAPDLLHRVTDIAHLLIVIATV